MTGMMNITYKKERRGSEYMKILILIAVILLGCNGCASKKEHIGNSETTPGSIIRTLFGRKRNSFFKLTNRSKEYAYAEFRISSDKTEG